MINKFALLTYSGEGLSVAKHFQDAIGDKGEVIVGMIEDTADIFLPSEIEAMKKDGKDPSQEDGQKNRFALYDGILNIVAADELIKYLKKQENKEEWFVFTDMNYCFKWATMAAEFMPYGLFPTAEQRELEVDREKAKQFIEEYYKDIAKQKYWEFKTVDEAMKFIDETDECLVLKGDGVDAPTVVPPTADVEACKEVLRDMLEKNKDKYNAGGMIFEVKLDDAVELTPERMYWNGVTLCTSLDIETKRKYAGDVGGELVGCGTDLVLNIGDEDKISKICFPPIVDEMARKAKGLMIWDLSVLISRASGKLYPGEFCANRAGWNSFVTEMEGKDCVQFFNDICDAKNPMAGKKFSSSLRVFNDDVSEKMKDQVKIIYPEESESHVWLIDAKKKDGELVTSGYMQDVAMITGHGDTFEDSVNNLYEVMKTFLLSTKRWGYKHKGDYMDTSYTTAIVNRYNYAVERGLIEGFNPVYVKDKNVQDLEAEYAMREQKMRAEHTTKLAEVRNQIKDILNEE